MNPRRFLPLLFVTLLLAASVQPPAAAQTPQFPIPSSFRELQATWIENAREDLDRFIANHDLPASTEAQLRQAMNATEAAYQDNRWTPVVRQLVGMRIFTRYIDIAQEARDSDQPQQVYLEELDPVYANVSARSREVRGDINSTADSVETVRGLEALYLGANLMVQGNGQLRQYPRFRSLMQASGNQTSQSILRTSVGTVVGAQWNFRYAQDVVQLSRKVDNGSRSPTVQASKVHLAWERMEEAVEATPEEGNEARRASSSMNLTTQREEWMVSTALGERYIFASIRTSLSRQQRNNELDPQRFQQNLEAKAGNLSLLIEMEKAGFSAIGLEDAYTDAYRVLQQGGGENASIRRAIDAFARLEAQGAASRSLLQVAEASSASGQAGVTDEGLGPFQAGLLGAALGAILGAGAVYVAREQGHL